MPEYVGRTVDLKERCRKHRSHIRDNLEMLDLPRLNMRQAVATEEALIGPLWPKASAAQGHETS